MCFLENVRNGISICLGVSEPTRQSPSQQTSTLDLINASHTEISDYFGSYFLASIRKVLMKNLKFLLFSTYVPVTLIKSKLQIHAGNPTNPDILNFFTKFS